MTILDDADELAQRVVYARYLERSDARLVTFEQWVEQQQQGGGYGNGNR